MKDSRSVAMGLALLAALAVGVVALVLAIDAKSGSASDEQLAQQVREEFDSRVTALRKNLGKQRRAGAEAAHEATKAEKTAKQVGEEETTLSDDVSHLKDEVAQLEQEVQSLTASRKAEEARINDLATRVKQLEKQADKG